MSVLNKVVSNHTYKPFINGSSEWGLTNQSYQPPSGMVLQVTGMFIGGPRCDVCFIVQGFGPINLGILFIYVPISQCILAIGCTMGMLMGINHPLPIGSMYAIYGDIYHQHTPNVSIYTWILWVIEFYVFLFSLSSRYHN